MEFMEYITVHQLDGVTLYQANQNPIEGTLCITGHHLILSSRQDQKEELWLLHKSVDTVEKKLNGSSGLITLKCKDFQIVKLEIPLAEDCLNIASSIEALSNIEDVTLSYPFYNRPLIDMLEDGWQAYTVEAEFNRVQSHLASEWRLSHVNKNFKVCPSYPQTVTVLKSIDDATIIKAAAFRQNGRFPVLSYYHKENGMVLMRCSQPMTGPSGRRCREDEQMVNSVLGFGKRIRGYILDTRSVNAAKLATAKGGRVEPEAYYPQWRRINQSIERPNVLHESLIKLIEVADEILTCYDVNTSSDKWLSKLDSSGWMTHVKDTLTCACAAAQYIDNGGSVLVHGGDGTDTTLQVVSLTQLILDPDCRTVTGFQALLEREWIQGGHPFANRCCKSAFAISKLRQESPVFLLFLDCVWQIWQQFSCSFEFNEEFLVILFKHAYASQFGPFVATNKQVAMKETGHRIDRRACSTLLATDLLDCLHGCENAMADLTIIHPSGCGESTFLGNNELERTQLKVKEKTISLWSYINCPKVLCEYMNPLYEPNNTILWPSVAPHSLQLWTSLYQSWQRYLPAQNEIWREVGEIKENNKQLKSRVIKLRKHLVRLEKEAIDNGLVQVTVAPEGGSQEQDQG